MNHVERAKKTSLAISLVRSKQSQFEFFELSKALKDAGCPYSQLVPTLLKKLNIIQKKNGLYEFTKAEPVHFHALEAGLEQLSKNQSQYTKKYLQPSKTLLKPIVTEEEAMITFLKNKGYRILRPEFVEI